MGSDSIVELSLPPPKRIVAYSPKTVHLVTKYKELFHKYTMVGRLESPNIFFFKPPEG